MDVEDMVFQTIWIQSIVVGDRRLQDVVMALHDPDERGQTIFMVHLDKRNMATSSQVVDDEVVDVRVVEERCQCALPKMRPEELGH
jgi:hypothetical protein